MTKAFARKQQNGALKNGLRWTPAYLLNVLQGKQKTRRLGAKSATPSIIAQTSALLNPPLSKGQDPAHTQPHHKKPASVTINSMATAALALDVGMPTSA